MAMRSMRLAIIVICFSIVLITSIPIVILSDALFPYDIVDFSDSYRSYKDNPFLVEELNIEADIGNIEIIYITHPVDYAVNIDLVIEMGGYNLNGKLVEDFFDIGWHETSNKLNFSVKLYEDFDLVEIRSFIRDVQIIVSLKASIKCDFNIDLINGNTKLIVPFGVSVGSILTNISKGNIQYELSYCTIDGNITGAVRDGNILFKTEKVQYSQNSKLTFCNYYGYTLIDILQNCEIGGNITGSATTELGIVKIIYEDDSPNIGAQFILNNKREMGAESVNSVIGFNHDASLSGQKFDSYDYPAQYNYNFSLHKPYSSSMGDYLWNLYSIPN